MRYSKWFFLVILCCSFSLFTNTWAATSRPSLQNKAWQQAIQWISTASEAYFRKHRLTGMSIGVVAGQRLLWSHHWGVTHAKSGAKPNNQTRYYIGSISKVFTAILAVSMRDQGILHLDAPLHQFLPQGTKIPTDPRGLPMITLRHLLTHTSGLPSLPHNLTPKGKDPYNNYTVQQMLAALPELSLSYPTGAQYSYSNFGYALLGYALTQKARKTYEQLLQERILRPLQMKNTTSITGPRRPVRLAFGYQKRALVQPWELGSFIPAGGIISSLQDMARFLSYQFRAGQTNLPALAGGSLTEMQSVHRLLGWFKKGYFKAGIGLGWHVFPSKKGNDRLVWHNGGVAGYRSFLGFSRSTRLGVIVLTNCGTSVDALGFSILEELSKRFWKKPSLQLHPRMRAVALQMKRYFVANPPKTLTSLFSPAFLAYIPFPRLKLLFSHFYRKLGAVRHVTLKPYRKANMAIAFMHFAGGNKIPVLFAVDNSKASRIVMLYFLPSKKKKAQTRRKPRPRSTSQPASRPASLPVSR